MVRTHFLSPEIENTASAPDIAGTVISSHYAERILGHYAKPVQRIAPAVDVWTLTLTAALAAIETCVRLDRYLPVTVDSRQRRDSLFRAAADPTPGIAHWSEWPYEALSVAPRAQALRLLDAARGADAPERAMQVELNNRPVDLNASRAPVRILCRLGEDMLSVIAVCAEDDPWAKACDAVAEMYAEILHDLLTTPLTEATATLGAARGIGAASLDMAVGALAGEAHDDGAWCAIPRMIEDSAARHPDRPAYCFDGRWLSYAGFDGRANAFAAQLRERGVTRGDIVPVLLTNSLEMPVAYHALMKLGAAFVPLDHAWPVERLAQALEDLSNGVVVCRDANELPAAFHARALPIDVERLAPLAVRPPVEIEPDDAIYGIFTSGTTGRAKCALNLHRGLTNRFRFMSRYFARVAGADACILQNSRHTFDSSVWQLFWPLVTGAQVVIPKQGAFLDLETTVDTIARYRVTMTDFVPSVFNQIVALAEHDSAICAKLSTLAELVVGGEEITPPMVHKMRTLLPHLRITNAYGPTETSIGMVFHPVEAADGMAIPIGRPIDNCYVVIVDDALRPLPPGACGELLVGGVCVGAGYVGRPDLTARVFIDNPFPTIPGATLYRTGDLGYFDGSGELRFVGRKDFQVKVGGVRIELGEIEAAAERCPHVHHAKAFVATERGARSIALFVTGEAELERATLEHHLRGFLPRASLPRHYFVLESMPLSENGKVNRKLLQQQLDDHLAAADRHAREDGEAAPPDDDADVTARVLAVFGAQLRRVDLRADDDFFAAGGDSLDALAAALELERRFALRFSVGDLLTHASAGKAAALIEQRLAGVDAHNDADAGADANTAADPATESDEALMERDAHFVMTSHATLFGTSVVPVVPVAADTAGANDTTAPATQHTWHPRHTWQAPRRVLLTGATGFVGSYLAKALLDHDDEMEVFALVRADGDPQRRLIDCLDHKHLWDARYAGRLHAVAGDLAAPGLGLDPAQRDALAARCDAIVHCGALVNFAYDYRAHRASNVLATQDLLRLSLEQRTKPFFFVSTLGALDQEAVRHTSPLDDSFDPNRAIAPRSGYSRSKWVAERLLLDARRAGLPVTILRLGEVMPASSATHSEEALPNPRALTHFLLTAIARLNARPSVTIRSDWSPVDYVASRLVSAIADVDAWDRTYHVFHPQSVCFAGALKRTGAALDMLPCREWLAALDAHLAQQPSRELELLRKLLPGTPGAEPELAAAFETLLTDNPCLFERSACDALERSHALAAVDLDDAMVRYARQLLNPR